MPWTYHDLGHRTSPRANLRALPSYRIGKSMDVQELIDRYPRLYHTAHVDAWAGIQAHGLLSTTALLDLFEVCGHNRDLIESTRRPESVVIEHRRFGRAVIRDNKPITDGQLARCLTGMAP